MKLARVNTGLLVLIIVVNVYVILAPFTPQVVYWWQSHHGDTRQKLTNQVMAASGNQDGKQTTSASASQVNNKPNQVIIPSMLLDQPILEGSIADTYSVLDKGIWRWPKGSTPDKGGNTVLLGHRFTYTKPQGVLYFLNKVSVGDVIGITWSNKQYIYKVSEVKVVGPNDTSIIAPTEDSRLTIYTCTPLWQPKQRLVVIAKLEA